MSEFGVEIRRPPFLEDVVNNRYNVEMCLHKGKSTNKSQLMELDEKEQLLLEG
jgi:hypothetical protein